MKYIIFDQNGLELPVVFPEMIGHDSMKNVFGNCPVVSAGFCRFYYDRDCDSTIAACWGESVSLGVKSREEDIRILANVNENY